MARGDQTALFPKFKDTWRKPTAFVARLHVEELESRDLLSAVAPFPAIVPNETLDQAQNLGDLSGAGPVVLAGNVGKVPAGAADVTWYQFNLTQPAQTNLAVQAVGGSFSGVVSLYNNDPGASNDPEDAIGHRLLAQSAGAADLEQNLAPGTYWVAVSGAGNRWFNPYLAGSGLPGSTGDFVASFDASNLPSNPTGNPTLLYSNPSNGAVVTDSPLVVRLDYSGPLDPNAIDLSATQLIFSPTSNFSDPNAESIALASYNFSGTANELQLIPTSALGPGYYAVFLADNSTSPALQFQIAGVEGGGTADDPAATAHQLGDLTHVGTIQFSGAIGDDPAYNPSNANPLLNNPASQVNLYHFQITGSGRYALGTDVYAGRIGSLLDPGVSLFQLNPASHRLDFIDGNDNSFNGAIATDGTAPLYTDSHLDVGLTAGDYYLAVSSGGNTPELDLGVLPGVNGVFDPNCSHSGSGGDSVGPYVVNLTVRADNVPPKVLAVSIAEGTTFAAPPTAFTVQFSESVNLQSPAAAFDTPSQNAVIPVYVEGTDGTRTYPRFESYDDATHQATFLMLDGLANGTYQLHLSGPLGLTDLAGNALVGNDSSGDYVIPFTVAGAVRGTDGNPLLWSDQEPNNDVLHPQDLGVLFPHELQAGVVVVRDFTRTPATDPADSADSFRFQVLQNTTYTFTLSDSGLPNGVELSLWDGQGNPVPATIVQDGRAMQAQFFPGTYVVRVDGWSPSQTGGPVNSGTYQVTLSLGEQSLNPTPLSVGPRPASVMTLLGGLPAATPLPQSVSTPPAAAPRIAPAAFFFGFNTSPGVFFPFETTSILTSNATPVVPGQYLGRGLPSGLLAPLGAGPVGGVEDTPAIGDVQRAGKILVQGAMALNNDVLPANYEPVERTVSRKPADPGVTLREPTLETDGKQADQDSGGMGSEQGATAASTVTLRSISWACLPFGGVLLLRLWRRRSRTGCLAGPRSTEDER